jgi:hypothetical protein
MNKYEYKANENIPCGKPKSSLISIDEYRPDLPRGSW